MHHRPVSTRLRVDIRLIAAAVLLTIVVSMLPHPAGAQTTPMPGSARVTFTVEDGLRIASSDLAERFAPLIAEAEIQFGALFAVQPDGVLEVQLVTTPDPLIIDTLIPIGTVGWVAADGSSLILASDAFNQLSEVEAGNVLRNAMARHYVAYASGGQGPPALIDGIARYMETPITARQARLGSLVQGRYQAGTLPTSLHLLAGIPNDLNVEESTAASYAYVAFLIERYGVAELQRLVRGFAGNPDWTAVVSGTLDTPLLTLDEAWDASLPGWFASGWRVNVVSAFDLARARQLFNRGAYEAAAAEASRSQQLFIDLDDQARLSEAESLLAQCGVGQQADTTMRDVEASLRAFDYVRASSLLDDAEMLYAVLPDEHRPAALLTSYRSLADQGQEAARRYDEGERDAGSLFSLRSARADALAAAETSARIGDGEAATRADELVARIDRRIERYVLMFAALTVVVGSWTAIWIWNRAPSRLQWQPGSHVVDPARTSQAR